MGYFIYLILCMFNGFICAKANIKIKDWKYWGSIMCVVGAYLCGKYGIN